ncbi:beta-1,3-galactosyltransferase 1-like [Varroa jacobsoni]|uniref:beta-1,3-galactosyltransferase 1-like n=1 Tax=Varroa jacobsoni TaxID=62625 RepID=UPI000BF591FF|nr:beta-1,3-galactosyltransferase 1-like [Varroa jacobsoni]XP_022697221.1 beta-1,3-galactosyltransferase 1-like [Varroa jacobsoni]XP_022697222.1 beta-1,3-galactosyltransferase 1-like [Varroa jacobsoni]XP_022697223.1 beta-1,3-galactosyltransferase 1-like [Varroa jacobsoni]
MWVRRGSLGLITPVVVFLVTAWVILDGTFHNGDNFDSPRVAFSPTTKNHQTVSGSVSMAATLKLIDAQLEAAELRVTSQTRMNYTVALFADQTRIPTDVGWTVQRPENFTVHKGFEPNPHNYTYILNTETLCNDFDHRRLRVLVFVETHVKNTERRMAIRKTWAQRELQKALNFRVVFLFANYGNGTVQQAALKEDYVYGDVSQEDFPEHFENLSIKSTMGLKYAVTFCKSAEYIIKIDDDIFLYMPNVIKSFESHRRTPAKDHLLCHRNRVERILRPGKSHEVHRIKTKKYEVSHDVIPGSSFPPYCSGFAYSMSLRAALKLYEASLGTPLFFIEDVYLTGFCRHKAGIGLIDHPGMALRPPVTEYNAPCYFHFAERITSNEISPMEMHDIWDAVNTAGYFCPK